MKLENENKIKICYSCGAKKTLSEYSKNRNSIDGYATQCKVCRSNKAKEARERKKEEENKIANRLREPVNCDGYGWIQTHIVAIVDGRVVDQYLLPEDGNKTVYMSIQSQWLDDKAFNALKKRRYFSYYEKGGHFNYTTDSDKINCFKVGNFELKIIELEIPIDAFQTALQESD